jgi:hypothetical protein
VNRSGSTSCPQRLYYGNAFDWTTTGPGALSLDIWHNDFEKIGTGSGITSTKRIAKPLDRAVNEFLQQWLGA